MIGAVYLYSVSLSNCGKYYVSCLQKSKRRRHLFLREQVASSLVTLKARLYTPSRKSALSLQPSGQARSGVTTFIFYINSLAFVCPRFQSFRFTQHRKWLLLPLFPPFVSTSLLRLPQHDKRSQRRLVVKLVRFELQHSSSNQLCPSITSFGLL